MSSHSDQALKEYHQHLAQGVYHHQKANIDKARACYQTCIDLAPDRPEGYFFLGVLLSQQQEWSNALTQLEQAHTIAPRHLDILNALGNSLKHLKEYHRAQTCFQQALTIDPNHITSLQNLGVLQQSQGQDKSAIQTFNTILDQDPNHHDARTNLSLLYAKSKQFDQVIHLLKPLKQSLNSTSALLLGQALVQMGHYQSALRYLKKALKTHDSCHDEIHFQLAITYDQLHVSSKAHWHYEQCIALDPEHLEAHSNLADSYVKTRHYQRAIPHYSFYLQHKPKDLETLYHLGLIYMQLDQHDKALEYFKATLNEQENHLAALLNLANIYLNINDQDSAILTYEQLLKHHPHHEEAIFTLNSLQGKDTPAQMPQPFVGQLFDQYANHYDEHLTKTLLYQAPQRLLELLCSNIHPASNSLAILDIGCGSGLMGDVMKGYIDFIDGIDLSEAMMHQCKAKHLYRTVRQGDFTHLDITSDYTLAVAADVLPYIGDLEPFFTRAYNCLKQGGHFLFTAEKNYDNDSYFLHSHIRYAHHPTYITNCLHQSGFELIADENAILRQQNGQDLHGHIYLAKKQGL